MAPRAVWKGSIRIGELVCPVAMYTAVSEAERVALHLVNRSTGHRLHRVYVDDKTGKPVESADQVKGYEISDGKYVVLEPEEIAAAVPNSDKTLMVDSFIACQKVDATYFDRPYYLLPGDEAAAESFVLLREGLRTQKVVAIAHAVLFRRLRPVLIRAHGKGLIATTLNFDYEVRSAKEAFDEIPARKIDPEMLELAQHIIETKAGSFDPAKFDDRYEAALTELVKAKMAGRKVVPLRRPEPTKPSDLLEALRMSAGAAGSPKASIKKAPKREAAAPKARRKAS